MQARPDDPAACPASDGATDPATGAPAGPVARVAVQFLCARRYLSMPDTRAAGVIARCPACGRAMTLPPRQDGDPPVRRFALSC